MVSACNNFQHYMKCLDINLHLLNSTVCTFNLTTKSHLIWKKFYSISLDPQYIHSLSLHLAYDSDPSLSLIILTNIITLFNELWEYEIMLIYWLLRKAQVPLAWQWDLSGMLFLAFHSLILFLERTLEVLTFPLDH